MITIDIVSDLVCPWCFMGKRRLAAAIAQVEQVHPGFSHRICWKPFFLNPNTPPEGEPYFPFLEKKFGSRANVDALFERVRLAGRQHGLDYAFEKIKLRANTLQAHRLIYWAQQHGDVEQLVERLFVAQFQRGEAIGDPATLIGIAAECGLPPFEVEKYLVSDEDLALIRQTERSYRQRGITMVPTFVLQDELIIVGAEDPGILAEKIIELL